MSDLSMEAKKELIFDYEITLAGQLARRVIDKPVPSVWMILVPIFFVFYGWKIKQYSNGLKDFTENYLISRRQALDTALEAEQSGKAPEVDQLVEMANTLPAKAQAYYRDWMSLLIDHYRRLLVTPGTSFQDLIRNHYRKKSSYQLFCKQLNKTENDFNMALLPGMEGDQQDLRFILDRMDRGIADLHRKEIEEIFL